MRGRICLISSEFLMKNELLHWNYTVLFKILKMEIAALLEAKLKNYASTKQFSLMNSFWSPMIPSMELENAILFLSPYGLTKVLLL